MKHLIYLIDGTWVFAGKLTGENRQSNIYHLNNMLHFRDHHSNPQIVHYIRGIGATKGLRKYSSGGFGYAINENVQDIYINICSNYEKGDKIYIFGFSRGAVIARAVCGMLDFGILRSDRIQYIDDVWTCYITGALRDQKLPISEKEEDDLAKSLVAVKDRTSDENPKVAFLGLFDTVLGGRSMTRKLQELNVLPGLVPRSVEVAVQLHAIDETRRFFDPQPFRFKNPQPFTESSLEQIWLPGVHTDIGGGYNDAFLSEISRALMLDRIFYHTDLNFDTEAKANLEDKIFKDPLQTIHVNNERRNNGLWAVASLFSSPRSIPRTMNKLHPIVDAIKAVDLIYKGERTRYEKSWPDDFPRSEFFLSPRYIGRRIPALD